MNGGKKRSASFGIPCSNTPPTLEVKKRIFDKMSGFVELFVIVAQYLTTFLWRDDNLATGFTCFAENTLRIIASVNQKPALSPSISAQASLQSARLPSVTATLTVISCASTERCNFEFSPPLCGPCLHCGPRHPRHEDEPYCGFINDEPFKIWGDDERFEYLLPSASITPPAEPTVRIFPVSKIRRKIPPRRACSQYPEDGIDK